MGSNSTNMNAENVQRSTFAFVVPTFNYAEYIERAIDSIVQQEGDDYQIIIVDDGSTDNTQQIIQLRYHSQKNLHLYYQKNQGPNVACAEAIRSSNAEYIIFMASDDALRADYLKIIREILQKDPSLEMIIGQACSISDDGKSKTSNHSFPLSSPLETFEKFIMGKLSTATCGTVVKREIMEPYINYIRPYPPNYDTVIIAHCLLNHHWYQSKAIFVDVYSHNRRFRDTHIPTELEKNIVDIMFDKNLIGTNTNFQAIKKNFLVKHFKSSARSFYRAKMWPQACGSYKSAFNINPFTVIDAVTLKRLIICYSSLTIQRLLSVFR